MSTCSLFDNVVEAEPVEVFHLAKLFKQDENENKVDLTVGVYQTEEGGDYVMPVVREAEQMLANDPTNFHDYLPLLGYEPFNECAKELLYGKDHIAVKELRVLAVQDLGGSGALRSGAYLLNKLLHINHVYISDPSWGNHANIFTTVGFENVHKYRYWHAKDRSLDIEGLIEDLFNAPPQSVVILHTCAHNPTGVDPNQAQWKRIAAVIKRKRLITFFDMAYHGFASGNLDEDAWPVRYFAEQPGMELLCAQTFAKSFSIYNERLGCLTMVVNNPAVLEPIRSQLTRQFRATRSSPPAHGAKIVHLILTNELMKARWLEELEEMVDRLPKHRRLLRKRLEEMETPGRWEHITEMKGMFAYLGINGYVLEHQVTYLREKHHIYMLKNSRINIYGINEGNIEYVANSIDDTVRNCNWRH